MMNESNFTVLNKLAKEHSIVLFGSTRASAVPLNELMQDYGLSQTIYNRSIPGLTLANAEKHLDACVFNLKPEKLILCLGEEDLKKENNVDKLIEQYRWLLYRIHTVVPETTMSVISVASSGKNAEKFNSALQKLANECGCEYLQFTPPENAEEYDLKFFRAIKSVFYSANMSYADAVRYCAI